MQQAVENADCISLAAGLVDEQSLPVQAAREAVQTILGDAAAGRKILQYGTTSGPEPLRQVLRSYLAELEQRIDGLADLPLSQIIMTTGSQQLLSLVTQALFNPGDICLVAAPTYFVYIGVLEAAGAKVVPVKSDENGMCPDALEQALLQIERDGQLDRVRLVYVVSYFENPSGISLSADRRPKVLELAKRFSEARASSCWKTQPIANCVSKANRCQAFGRSTKAIRTLSWLRRFRRASRQACESALVCCHRI